MSVGYTLNGIINGAFVSAIGWVLVLVFQNTIIGTIGIVIAFAGLLIAAYYFLGVRFWLIPVKEVDEL